MGRSQREGDRLIHTFELVIVPAIKHPEPYAWEGSVVTEAESHVYEVITRRGVVLQDRELRSSTADIELHWRARGPEQITHELKPTCVSAINRRFCSLAFVQHPAVRIQRDAIVRGSVTFNGLGMTVRLPKGHPGWMRYDVPAWRG